MGAATDARLTVRHLLGMGAPEQTVPSSIRRRPIGIRDGVQWESLTVGCADGDTVPCFLLTPENVSGPDVIALHQHAASFAVGKSEPAGLEGDPSLAYGIRLARRGARVLMPDLVGFEGRQRGWTADAAADEQLDALLRIADGSSLQAKHNRDVAVLTSWLADAYGGDRGIGVMGHSLGGQVALFSLALDPRLTIGAISCSVGTLASFAKHHVHHNPAWFVPGLAAAGDTPLLASAIQDQKVFVSIGVQDQLFPIEGARAVVRGFNESVCTPQEFEGGHELPPQVMERALDHIMRVAR